MATVIRFARHGSKKKPYFRMVVQDHRSARDGRFIEHIGSFQPIKGGETIEVDRARLEYWMGTGAQLSESVRNRLKLKFNEWGMGMTTPAPSTPKAPKAAAPAADKKPKAKASKEKTKEA